MADGSPTLAPPAPAIFMGAASIFGMAGISGRVTLEAPVETMRRTGAGALAVFCFLAICTLCSSARVARLGEGGLP